MPRAAPWAEGTDELAGSFAVRGAGFGVIFASGVVGVGVLYGLYVGNLGADGAKVFSGSTNSVETDEIPQ